ncbi:acyltransferase [Kribbella sp. GL6]|uniref:acyltransferase n=1 Tax=Kribbella sp. GL6 TaxID=3419765 RepID=UPI003CFC7239
MTTADAGVQIGYPPARPVDPELELGPDARLRSGSVLYGGSRIGARFETGHNVVIREQCEIGDDVSVWSNTVVDYGCRIGDGVKIHTNCYVAQYTDIGDGAFLAPGVTVANDLYPGREESAEVMSGPAIGAGAQLGVNVTVLPFVRIGEGCIVGAGSVVTRDLPPKCVAYGNPARVHGTVDGLVDISQRIEADDASASRFTFSATASADREGRV